MKRILSERNLVVVLFVMVLVIFSLAQEDTKKIEKMYQDANSPVTSSLDPVQNDGTTKQETTTSITPGIKAR